MSLSVVGGLEVRDLQVPSNPNYPMILWNIISSAFDSPVWEELQEKQIWTVSTGEEGSRLMSLLGCGQALDVCASLPAQLRLWSSTYAAQCNLFSLNNFNIQGLWCQEKEKNNFFLAACFRWMWLLGGLGASQAWLWLKIVVCSNSHDHMWFLDSVILPHANALFPRFMHFLNGIHHP